MELFPVWGLFWFFFLWFWRQPVLTPRQSRRQWSHSPEMQKRASDSSSNTTVVFMVAGWAVSSRAWLFLRKHDLDSVLRCQPHLYVCLHHWVCCVRLCMFIFALSTLILEQHFQPFFSVAISTEVSRAVSQEWCFFIKGSHEEFRCVRYTLCIVILGEIMWQFPPEGPQKIPAGKRAAAQTALRFSLCSPISAYFCEVLFHEKNIEWNAAVAERLSFYFCASPK